MYSTSFLLSFFLSHLTEHTNASLSLSASLSLLSSSSHILLLILITEFFCSFSSPLDLKLKKNMTFRFKFIIGFKVFKKMWSLGLNLPLGLKLKKIYMTFRFEFTIGFKVKKIWPLGLNLPLGLKLGLNLLFEFQNYDW